MISLPNLFLGNIPLTALIITLSESFDVEMMVMHQQYVHDNDLGTHNSNKINRRMGYISSVTDTTINKLVPPKKNGTANRAINNSGNMATATKYIAPTTVNRVKIKSKY